MRNGIADALAVALIALFSTIITVVFDNESDGKLTNIIYMDNNLSNCEKSYPKIILTDRKY